LDALKAEFKRLFEASGWSQAEAARQLDLTRGGVNGIVTGPNSVSEATVRLFRYVLAEKGIILGDQAHGPIRETAGESDLELWKRRAKAAEKENAEIKAILRALISSPAANKIASGESINSGQTGQEEDTGAGNKIREIFEPPTTRPPDRRQP